MLSPKVTVIIVFLNEERYLSEAVESVSRQTWLDWELLLVDDGSKDQSSRIALELAARRPERVKYLEHPGHANRGISISRNLGVAQARGRYIAFLDADDLWTATKLEHQVAILDQYPECAMTFGRLHYFTDEPDIPVPQGLAPLRVPQGVLRPPAVFKQSLIGRGGMLWTTGTILFRKQALLEVKAFEASFPGLGDDAVVWLKIALSYHVYALDECLLEYRRHSRASGIRDWRAGTSASGWVKVIKWLYEYLREQPSDIQHWALPIVREALFRSLYEETRSIIAGTSKPVAHRLADAARLWLNAFRRYPEISAWRCLPQLVSLPLSWTRTFFRDRTRLAKHRRALN